MSTTPPAPPVHRTINVPQLIGAMLVAKTHVSDLIFSPGRAPQVEVSGQLVELKFKGLEHLSPFDTEHIAQAIIGKNEHAAHKLEKDGIRRSFLRCGQRALSGEYLPATGKLRDCDARDSR